jgi:neurofibromin 1
VHTKIWSVIEKGCEGKDNDETTNQYLMLQHLDMNTKRLTNLFSKIMQNINAYAKKPNHQLLLAKAFRKAIWNWIDSYPMEFVQLCKSGQRFPG